MTSQNDPEIRRVGFGALTARRLVLAQQFEIGLMYHEESSAYAVLDAPGKPTEYDFSDGARGAFFVAYLDGRPAGCGGIRTFSYDAPDTAEIKRMYTRPEARGYGIARAVVVALEDAARSFRYQSVRLETGLVQPAAIALYEKMNYRRTARYGKYAGDPLSRCYQKVL